MMALFDRQTDTDLREELPESISKRELSRMNWQASGRLLHDRRFWVLAVAYGTTGALVSIVVRLLPLDWFGDYRLLGRVLVHSLMLLPFIIMYMALIHPRHRVHFRAIARERGHELCPHCGYVLAMLGPTVQRCPECGAEREPLPGKIDA